MPVASGSAQTRLLSVGIGGQRAASFAGKEAAVAVVGGRVRRGIFRRLGGYN